MPRKLSTAFSAKAAWIISTFGYGCLRVFLAHAYLSEYGLNIWLFAAIEISSSLLFGVASSRFVENLVRGVKQHRIRLGLAALSGYFAPDAYVLAASGEYPPTLRTIVSIIVLVSAVFTVVTLIAKVRNGRRSEESFSDQFTNK